LLKLADLKNWLNRDLPKADKLLLILWSINAPCQVRDIKARGKEAGLRSTEKWNVSLILSRTNGLAIKTPSGWELSDAGKERLRKLGVAEISPAAGKIVTDLRVLLPKVNDPDTKAFVEEAVQCYEFELYRSAVVMSWLAAMHVLKLEVHKRHLAAFNSEAQKNDPKWKPARTTDELGLMKEAVFLDRLAAISIIEKMLRTSFRPASSGVTAAVIQIA
jgi:hypothetical protein